MRWIRLLFALLRAGYKKKLSIVENSQMDFRVWITDVDASIMNHAAMMTVLECGRIDFMVRTGFFLLARRENWYVPSSGIHVQFMRPLKIFQKATVVTKLISGNERSICLEQKVLKSEKLVAACIVECTVRKGRETVDVNEIIRRLGADRLEPQAEDLIDSFHKTAGMIRGHATGS